MKAHGGLARIAGFPVRGGVVSLDNADVQVAANATAGLIRETAGVIKTGIKAGVVVAGLLALLLYLQSPKTQTVKTETEAERQKKMREAWLRTPPLPLSTFCRVIVSKRGGPDHGASASFHGVLLNNALHFRCKSSSTFLRARLEHTIALQTENENRSFWSTTLGHTIVMADGSTFSGVEFLEPLRFATPCGEFTVPLNKEAYDIQILPFTEDSLAELRDRMINFFQKAERNLVGELDLSILRKYFVLNEPEHNAEPAPPTPAARYSRRQRARSIAIKLIPAWSLKKWANEHGLALFVVAVVGLICLGKFILS